MAKFMTQNMNTMGEPVIHEHDTVEELAEKLDSSYPLGDSFGGAEIDHPDGTYTVGLSQCGWVHAGEYIIQMSR